MKKALIVEDNPVWSDILSGYCREEQLLPVTARSPQEAMDVLDMEAVDIIILDILLATETGMALLNEIGSHDDLATIPIIVCTDLNSIGMAELAPFGVQKLLDKSSMNPASMKLAIREVCNE